MYFIGSKASVVFLILATLDLGHTPVSGSACLVGQCRELAEGETCQTLAAKAGYATSAATLVGSPPACPQRSCSPCTQCDPSSSLLKPTILGISFEHANNNKFVVTINWEQPPSMSNVTGYTILISDSPSDTCEVIIGSTSGNCDRQCAYVPGSYREFSFTGYYTRFSPMETTYVKLIPHPLRCAESSVATASYLVPVRCHNVLPGDCNTCGKSDPLPPRPEKVTAHWDHDGMNLLISWELTATYYYPYPEKTFYVTVTREPERTMAAPVLEVVGRSNVTVTNLDPYSDYSVKIRFCDCGCSFSSLKANTVGIPRPSTEPVPQPTGTSLPTAIRTASQNESSLPPGGASSVLQQSPVQPSPTQSNVAVIQLSSTPGNHPVSTTDFNHVESRAVEVSSTFQSVVRSYESVQSTPTVLTVLPSNPHPGTATVLPTTDSEGKPSSDLHYTQTFTIAALVLMTLLLAIAVCCAMAYLCRNGNSHVSTSNSLPAKIPFEAKGETCWFTTEETTGNLYAPTTAGIVSPMISLVTVAGEETGAPHDPQLYRQLSDESDTTIRITLEEDEHQHRHPATVNSTDTQEKENKVLIVYSDHSSEIETKRTLYLFSELQSFRDIEVKMESLEVVRESPPAWVEKTVKECSTILCVCNPQFKEEWEKGRGGSLVSMVRHLYEGNVNQSDERDMAKYAVVLLHEDDKLLIPAYLKNRRCFEFTYPKFNTTKIVHFVTNTPENYIHR